MSKGEAINIWSYCFLDLSAQEIQVTTLISYNNPILIVCKLEKKYV